MKNILEDIIKESIAKKEAAGASVLVRKNGEDYCFAAEGFADRELQKPMQRNSIFRMYSQTKPVCAAAAMILVQKGLLNLERPAADYLPAFRDAFVWKQDQKEKISDSIKVLDLLHMTSGLCYPDAPGMCGKKISEVFAEIERRLLGEDPVSTIEAANKIAACGLLFEPGTSWEYGTSADVLGAVIEVVSGKKLDDFMREEIFDPLEMYDTDFWVPKEKQSRLAAAYRTVVRNGVKEIVPYRGNHLGIRNQMDEPPAFVSGGAGMASTLDDYMHFAEMLLNDGTYKEKQILTKESVSFLTKGCMDEHLTDVFVEKIGLNGYRYGSFMRKCVNASIAQAPSRNEEYGWDGWLGTSFYNFPIENMTILIGMQKYDASECDLALQLKGAVLDIL